MKTIVLIILIRLFMPSVATEPPPRLPDMPDVSPMRPNFD